MNKASTTTKLEYTTTQRARSPYVCTRTGAQWIVITSINYPTQSIRLFAQLHDWNVLVVADVDTPVDWFKNDAKLNVVFLSMHQQQTLDFDMVDVLPTHNYARKNLGYLCAIQCGANIIYETDDDNSLIIPDQLSLLSSNDLLNVSEAIASIGSNYANFVNPYAYFGRPDIWPRGYPLRAIRDAQSNEFYNVRQPGFVVHGWIQQSLADLDPDVDAIYRLTQHRNIGHVKFNAFPDAITIPARTFVPFNTQNTFYMYEAFWGLLLPFTTSFRVCDIWRGYWVQRLLWDLGGTLVFRPPLVNQVRNPHDLMRDFEDELPLYLRAESLSKFLDEWKSDEDQGLLTNIQILFEQMAVNEFWNKDEVLAAKAWAADLKRVGYVAPQLIPKPRDRYVETASNSNRVAVCITGQLDRISEAWPFMSGAIKKLLAGKEYDLFYFLSTFKSENISDEVYVKTKLHCKRGVIYNDPPLTKWNTVPLQRFGLGRGKGKTRSNVVQQLYALKRCFELTQTESITGNKYAYLLRLRSDHVLPLSSVNITHIWNAIDKDDKLIIPSGYSYGGLNDRFAFGRYRTMEHYMRRYDEMSVEGNETLGAETFLVEVLERHNIQVQHVDIVYEEVRDFLDA